MPKLVLFADDGSKIKQWSLTSGPNAYGALTLQEPIHTEYILKEMQRLLEEHDLRRAQLNE